MGRAAPVFVPILRFRGVDVKVEVCAVDFVAELIALELGLVTVCLERIVFRTAVEGLMAVVRLIVGFRIESALSYMLAAKALCSVGLDTVPAVLLITACSLLSLVNLSIGFSLLRSDTVGLGLIMDA